MPKQMHYLEGLNGLRAIAALAVIYSHINQSMHLYGLPLLPHNDLAEYGVTLFFALSGFLISWLLIREKEQTLNISLRKFYLRRILRIWPLYFIYLIIIIIFISPPPYPDNRLLHYLFLAPNMAFAMGIWIPGLSHYWSLGVEEQFYLFWPWLIRYSKHYFSVLLGFVILFFSLKLGVRLLTSGQSPFYQFLYITRFGCMGIGALGAVLYLYQREKLKILCHPLIQLACWMFMFLLLLNAFYLKDIINHEIVAIWTVLMIFHQILPHRKLINLEQAPMNYLGKISFGLYVWHPLMLFLTSWWLQNAEFSLSVKYGLIYSSVIMGSILIAHLSYHYLERPFLRIKSRYTVVKSLGNP